MKKNILIKKEDYERYKIPLPLSVIFPKAKQKYIFEELEKRHPCFSNEFCFCFVHKILKKGLYSDVVVMEKSKLAEYKNKYKKAELLLEENNKIKVFSKKKYIQYISIIFIIFLSSIIIFIKLFNYQKKEFLNRNDIELIKNIDSSKKINLLTDCKENNLSCQKENYDNFFEIIRKENGKINNLFWKIDCLQEQFSGSVENIYPETIQNVLEKVEISTVTYSKQKPYFDFHFSKELYLDSEKSQEKLITIDTKKIVRNLIKSNCSILSETTNPFGVNVELDIEFDKKNGVTDFFLALNELINKKNIFVMEFSVIVTKKNDVNNMKCNMFFSANKSYENNILEYVGNNIDLFLNKSSLYTTPEKHNANKNNLIDNSNKLIIKNGLNQGHHKIGELNYKNGKKIIFYRTSEGKIIKEVL